MQRRTSSCLFIYQHGSRNLGDERPAFQASARRLAKTCRLNGTAPFHQDPGINARFPARASRQSQGHLCNCCQEYPVTEVTGGGGARYGQKKSAVIVKKRGYGMHNRAADGEIFF